MMDPFVLLRRELVSAADRAALPAPRRRLRWVRELWRRRPLAVVIAALVVTGSAAAAVVSLAVSPSAPLTGTVPPFKGVTTAGLRYDIPVTPDLEAGNAGWCSYPSFSYGGGPPRLGPINRLNGGGTCVPAVAGDPPVVLGGGENGLFWMIVSSRVAELRLGHQLIRPHGDARLPFGWRAVVTFSPAFNPRTRPVPRALPNPVPLDARGQPIGLGSVPSLPQAPTRSVDPNHPSGGICSLGAAHVAGITRQWQVVITSIPHLESSVAQGALLSCARSWYLVDNTSPAISAAVLINARHPSESVPVLPNLRPTADHGIFTEDGGSAGQLSARRIGPAWLVVEGGTPQIRASLLRGLAVRTVP